MFVSLVVAKGSIAGGVLEYCGSGMKEREMAEWDSRRAGFGSNVESYSISDPTLL